MLHAETFEIVRGLSQSWSERQLTAVPQPNSVLAELVRVSTPPTTVVIDRPTEYTDEQYIQGTAADSVWATTGSMEMPSEHTRSMDAMIRDISAAVTAHISNARNIIMPLVVECAEGIIHQRQEHGSLDPARAFNVITMSIPDILKDDFFLDAIAQYRDRSPLTPDAALALPMMSADDLIEMLSTGESRTDGIITEWYHGIDPGLLLKIWTNFFTSSPVDTSVIDGIPSHMLSSSIGCMEGLNVYDQATVALLTYLLARHISMSVLESNMTLAQYRKIVQQYQEYAGAVLAKCVKKMSLFNTSGQMVIDIDQARKTIRVNADVYSPWIAEGGSPEVILGLLVSGERVYQASLIDQKRDRYIAAWHSYYTFARSSESKQYLHSMHGYLKMTFGRMYEHLTELEEQYVATHPKAAAVISELAEHYIHSVSLKDLEDPYYVALHLIAGCRFHYTSGYEILADMHEAATVNPNIDPREAALLASITYISDYLAAQMSLV
jgi:hypothetical protein